MEFCAYHFIVMCTWRISSRVSPWAHPHLTVRMEINVSLQLKPALVQIFPDVVGHLLGKWPFSGIYVTTWSL